MLQQNVLFSYLYTFTYSSFIFRISHKLSCYIRMSFGFSIGDFVAVLQLANDTRKQFVYSFMLQANIRQSPTSQVFFLNICLSAYSF